MGHWLCLLPGALVVTAGLLLALGPPRSRSSRFAYRSERCRSSEEAWNEGNRFAGWAIVVSGFLSLNMAVTCIVLNFQETKARALVWGVQIILLILALLITERWLRARYDPDGRPLD